MLKQESQTVEFGELGENGRKYLEKGKYVLRRRRKIEKEKERDIIEEENIWPLQCIGSNEKRKRRRKIFFCGEGNQRKKRGEYLKKETVFFGGEEKR